MGRGRKGCREGDIEITTKIWLCCCTMYNRIIFFFSWDVLNMCCWGINRLGMAGFGGGGGAGRSKEEGLQRGGSWDNKGNTIMLLYIVQQNSISIVLFFSPLTQQRRQGFVVLVCNRNMFLWKGQFWKNIKKLSIWVVTLTKLVVSIVVPPIQI